MEDRLFFALFVPLSLVVFLGIPALLLTTLGPELDLLRVDDAAAAAMASSLRTGTSASAAEQRLQQHTPLCDVDEEAALAGQLRAATHSSVLEPVLERLWECWLGERGRVAQDYLDSGTDLMSSGQLSSAARIFQSAREQYPGFRHLLCQAAVRSPLRSSGSGCIGNAESCARSCCALLHTRVQLHYEACSSRIIKRICAVAAAPKSNTTLPSRWGAPPASTILIAPACCV